MYSSHLLESDFALTPGKHTQMTKENSKGMRDLSASNISHVSRKPLQCIHITTPCAGHVVEVTFRNHYNVCDMFSNRTWLSSSLFNRRKNCVIFYGDLSHTEVMISHETKLNGIYETDMRDKSHILWLVVG